MTTNSTKRPGLLLAAIPAVLALLFLTCEEPTAPPDTSPPAEITLSVSASTDSSVDITWTDPSDADFSHVLITWEPTGGNETQPLRVEKGVGSATITGLSHDTNYMFTAVSVDTTGNKSPGGTPAPATAMDATAPADVTDINVAVRANGGAELTWTDPADADFSHVLITWEPAGGNETQPLNVAKGVQAAAITGLTDGEYMFAITSVDTVGNAAESAASATGTADATAPNPVTLTVTAQTNGAAEVTWTEPTAADYSHILLSWTPEAGLPAQPLRVDSGTTTAAITGLTDGTEYMFTAVSVDALGNQSASSDEAAVTADSTPPGAVTNISTALTSTTISLTWTDPSDSDLSHVELTWLPADGGQTSPLRVEAGVQAGQVTGLNSNAQYTITITTFDAAGHAGTAATARATTTAAITIASATALSVAGATTITWTDPSPTDGIAKISITGTPEPTTAVEVALGVGTASISGLTSPGSEHTFTIATLNSTGTVLSTIEVIAADATAANRPVAMFRLGGAVTHLGNTVYGACNTELTTDTGAVAAALRAAGYSEAVFFGSKREAPGIYNFIDIATDTDALGINGASATVLEARPVVVYPTGYTSGDPTSTFGSPLVTRTLSDVLDIDTSTGAWESNGNDVIDDLVTGTFWSFTTAGGIGSSFDCTNPLRSGGRVGNSTAIGSDITGGTCTVPEPVICVAH